MRRMLLLSGQEVSKIELKQRPKTTGVLLYEGPSLLNGDPIFVVGTLKSSNVKTGDMIQTWILPQKTKPVDAVKDGSDVSICGDCPHRRINGKRTCYVNVGQAPRAVWQSWSEGKYPPVEDLMSVSKGRKIRFGAYGDPAAVPSAIWEDIALDSDGWTGYTHQWKTCDQRLREIMMASTDSEEETLLAWSMGWRTFRIRKTGEPLMPGEIDCPASEAAGKLTTCENCLLCRGKYSDKRNKIPSISIEVHGPGAVNFGSSNQ